MATSSFGSCLKVTNKDVKKLRDILSSKKRIKGIAEVRNTDLKGEDVKKFLFGKR